jgi:hypothetical protein
MVTIKFAFPWGRYYAHPWGINPTRLREATSSLVGRRTSATIPRPRGRGPVEALIRMITFT